MAANSGIKWIDTTFDAAVTALYWTADLFGVTYEEINVYIFCILWPLTVVVLIAQTFWIVRLYRR
tara:strand:- start:202 stop:396 length:195 start_codon:yes stop_codon:yes gene_type:complete